MRQKLVALLVAQLNQGTTAERLALSVALGLAFASTPLLGAATPLCLAAGVLLKLNQPTLQLVNYLATPLQFALFVPFLRLGDRLFGVEPAPIDAAAVIRGFQSDWIGGVKAFGAAELRGAAVWGLAAPVFAFAVYKLLVPIIAKLGKRPNQYRTREGRTWNSGRM